MKQRQTSAVAALLQSREIWCMNACNRFINRESLKSKVWTLNDRDGNLSSLIIHSRQSLLPVLCGHDVPPPHFLYGLSGESRIYSIQGIQRDVLILETELKKTGLIASESIDYDLMVLDRPPSGFLTSGPAALVIRRAYLSDMDELVALHAAYEQEEVLPAAAEFNATASRLNIERIFAEEHMLVAELGGCLVGKINTNATAFTRCQIGGVYVHPGCRSLGIARRMAGEFTANLVAQGRGISLFVKKSNPAARRVYRHIGFTLTGDYRISYY